MRLSLTAGAALLLTTSVASAGGLDRSGQPVGLIFEEGNVAQLSFGYVMPTISGEVTTNALAGLGTPQGSESGDMAGDYLQLGGGIKMQATPELSYAVIFDQPYGAAVDYSDGDATYPANGTTANVTSTGFTGIVRYEIDDNFSVHGGARYITVEGDFDPSTSAYQSDYSAGSTVSYIAGAAYEREEIALRVALTYATAHDVELDGSAGDLTANLPESINLDFQTGIAADTLLFGTVRYVAWDGTELLDSVAGSLVTYSNDTYTYNLGVGRRINDQVALSISAGYEAGTDETASNLAPADGNISLSAGGAYQVSDQIEVSGGLRYVSIGDAKTDLGTGGTDTAFADNSALGLGMQVAYSF